MRIWAIVRKKLKMVAHHEIECEKMEWTTDSLSQAITPLCEKMDLARPVILDKHVEQWTQFGKTAFRDADFIEPIAFDVLEIEAILDDEEEIL